MSVFSVLADSQAGRFRLQQAKKPWEKELEAKDGLGQLAQKAEKAQSATNRGLDAWRANNASGQAALEEARKVNGPKQAAAAKMEQVERRIEELKLAMRFAKGDPDKLASLAREAALLAREAGRAAKEYGSGISAAVQMGLPGDMSAVSGGASGGVLMSSETTITTRTTTLTVQQTEITLSIGITDGGAAGGGADLAPGAASSADALAAEAGAGSDTALAAALGGSDLAAGVAASGIAASAIAGEAASAASSAASSGDGDSGASSDEENLPEDVRRMVDETLRGLGRNGLSGASEGGGTDRASMIRGLMADNEARMSRYREADGFGQRVEKVLGHVKAIIGEAKAANMLDESERRRRDRREGFKADDKMVDGAQAEVNRLRADALAPGDGVKALLAGGTEGEAGSDLTGGVAALLGGGGANSGVLNLLA